MTLEVICNHVLTPTSENTPCNLTVLFGHPCEGPKALTRTIAAEIAKNKPVLYCSFSDSDTAIKKHLEALGYSAENICIIDDTHISQKHIQTAIEKQVGLIVVDHLRLAGKLQTIENIFKDCACPVLVLSFLSSHTDYSIPPALYNHGNTRTDFKKIRILSLPIGGFSESELLTVKPEWKPEWKIELFGPGNNDCIDSEKGAWDSTLCRIWY